MFKLKIINRPKMIKMKCNIEFPDIILANLQEKEVIPTKETQEIIADSNYDGLSKVTVNPIPNEYIIPTGEIEFTQNGTYDVTDKASAKVNVPEKQLGTKTITTNGTYKATDDNLDGYSEVEVATSGVDINEYLSDTITKGDYTAGGWIKTIKKLRSPLTIEGTDATYMFYRYLLNELPQLDTSNVTNMNYMFSNCPNLTTIPQLNGEKLTSVAGTFGNCRSLENFNGIINLGQAYLTTQSANYSNYKLDLSYSTLLTEQSIINILNNLYDIATLGVKSQQLILGSTNLAKLTEEEIAIATNKGWSVS